MRGCWWHLSLLFFITYWFTSKTSGKEILELDPSLVDVDLYAKLGLRKTATLIDIKKSYRLLARKHHPDKITDAAQKSANAVIFQGIAQAHEVLANSESRNAYDRGRAARAAELEHRKRHDEEQRYMRDYYHHHHHHQQQQQQQQYRDEFDGEFYGYGGFEEGFIDDSYYELYHGVNPGHNYPLVVTGNIIRSRDPLFPYDPIIASPDRAFFAFLDGHCSLGVYKGDLDQVLRHFYSHNSRDLTNLPVELLFRTQGDPGLQGQCFAALDDGGVLRIYKGHPDFDYKSIWESIPPKEEDIFFTFTTFYIELTSTGEFAVLSLRSGNSEPECVWSSTSCSLYLAILQEMKVESLRIFRGVFDTLKNFIRGVVRLVDELLLNDEPLNLIKSHARQLAQQFQSFAQRTYREFFP